MLIYLAGIQLNIFLLSFIFAISFGLTFVYAIEQKWDKKVRYFILLLSVLFTAVMMFLPSEDYLYKAAGCTNNKELIYGSYLCNGKEYH
jgi:hypothetical protein